MTLLPRSLTARLALLTGAWVTSGLVLVWLLVTGILTRAAERSFDARLVSLVDALVAVTALENGQPYLLRPVSEPRFDRPLSGVYYQIEGPKGTFITSPSLGTEQLPAGKFGHFGILMTDMPGRETSICDWLSGTSSCRTPSERHTFWWRRHWTTR